jgi:redox-sensitive bicupin YhaK (pirin superfamily)
MTAASGILHQEYHEASFAARGGTFHMAQLWVNLPRAHKMDPPGIKGSRQRASPKWRSRMAPVKCA